MRIQWHLRPHSVWKSEEPRAELTPPWPLGLCFSLPVLCTTWEHTLQAISVSGISGEGLPQDQKGCASQLVLETPPRKVPCILSPRWENFSKAT